MGNDSSDSVTIHSYWAKQLAQVSGQNEELLKLRQQQHQFKMAIVECEKVLEDIHNKVITKVLIPTVGNNFIQINANNEKYKNMIKERMKQFDTSMKGIDGQITRREDAMNESLLKLHRFIGKYIKEQGLEVPE